MDDLTREQLIYIRDCAARDYHDHDNQIAGELLEAIAQELRIRSVTEPTKLSSGRY